MSERPWEMLVMSLLPARSCGGRRRDALLLSAETFLILIAKIAILQLLHSFLCFQLLTEPFWLFHCTFSGPHGQTPCRERPGLPTPQSAGSTSTPRGCVRVAGGALVPSFPAAPRDSPQAASAAVGLKEHGQNQQPKKCVPIRVRVAGSVWLRPRG